MTYQYMLIQCPVCQNWFYIRGLAGKRASVSLSTLAKAEIIIGEECRRTHHKGRRRWKTTATTK